MFVTFHVDAQVDEVTDVRLWPTKERAEGYVNLPRNGGEMWLEVHPVEMELFAPDVA